MYTQASQRAVLHVEPATYSDRAPTKTGTHYSGPSLIRPPKLARNCGHIREIALGEREK